MNSAGTPTAREYGHEPFSSPPLPAWLARNFEVGFNEDDVAALIGSIESSQIPACPVAYLPAEILLHILEYVPVDYVLDWRLICRGFRDAIDGRISFYHLQRTQLVGYVGPRFMWPLQNLSDELYDRMQFLYADFHHVEDVVANERGRWNCAAEERRSVGGPLWSKKHAVFDIDYSNFGAKPKTDNAGQVFDSTIDYAETIWQHATRRLELSSVEEGHGSLKWCIKIDHAVQDLDVPLETSRIGFDVAVNLDKGIVKVAWKDMLFQFFKTESALRRLTAKKKESNFTFSAEEDCLREIRRQRLQAELDPDTKADRHLKWALRLLPPLFGKPKQDLSPLELTESIAVNALMFLRRKASMTPKYIAHLHQLKADFHRMYEEMKQLEEEFSTFRAHLSPWLAQTATTRTQPEENVPYNPIVWSDSLRETIEDRVSKWRSQKKVMDQMRAILASSNQALALPEDSFDDLESDI
ncbi:hypothetical protein BDU57DRAFT_437021 [Ampelomyces quisqualis]|uniref:F-box domain-containing protein n=1 Tax=Ampelomyces quisqualis TaxID=50730 RepID=A0A6A5R6K7_AMPQU|nr:hypothetical protein BDU57DRAFT_437021 [Ampelomyces quisqualis]